MKYCFKCGGFYSDEKMVAKFSLNGKRIGAQCVNCIKNKSHSIYGRPPAEAGDGVCTTPEPQLPKAQG